MKKQFICAVAIGALVVACKPAMDLDKPGAVNAEKLVNAASNHAEWLSYGRTYDEQRFSPLNSINAENVSGLNLAWFADLDTSRGQEATPLVIDGKIYISTAWSKVKAYDAVY